MFYVTNHHSRERNEILVWRERDRAMRRSRAERLGNEIHIRQSTDFMYIIGCS